MPSEPHASFTLSASGRFMERYGAAGHHAACSRKKLCLAASDHAFLIALLARLSRRPDCAYVKYSVVARDGMLLGRCFMQTDRAAGELCEALKQHPKLLVSLQDDDFFEAFRSPDVPLALGNCGVWDAWPEDAAAIDEIHTLAFGRRDEARMVAAASESSADRISLLAGVEGERLGHVLFSPVTIDGEARPEGMGLAPIAVVPAAQRRGVGSALIDAGLQRCRLLGYDYVVVLGHPQYYPRFGFQRASVYGLRYEQPVPDEVFMAIELREGCLTARGGGVVRYLPAFRDDGAMTGGASGSRS